MPIPDWLKETMDGQGIVWEEMESWLKSPCKRAFDSICLRGQAIANDNCRNAANFEQKEYWRGYHKAFGLMLGTFPKWLEQGTRTNGEDTQSEKARSGPGLPC